MGRGVSDDVPRIPKRILLDRRGGSHLALQTRVFMLCLLLLLPEMAVNYSHDSFSLVWISLGIQRSKRCEVHPFCL